MTDNDRMQISGDDWRSLLSVESERTGGDPSILFDYLSMVIESKAWEGLLDSEGQPIGSFRRLIELPLPDGCGIDARRLLQMMSLEHRYERRDAKTRARMVALRERVIKELKPTVEAEIPAVQEAGTNRYTSSPDMSGLETGYGNSRQYRIGRLQKEAPDLAERVIADEISAAEGIRQLEARQGKTKTRLTINMDDLESAAASMLKYMTDDQINELIDLLRG